MRHLSLGMGLGLVLLSTGCNSFAVMRGAGTPQPVARVPNEVPSKEAILAYLNDNAARVQSVRCKELDLDVRQGIQPGIGLRGQVVCQKPRNFRMGANVLGHQEVDLGSNDQEFWFWVKRNNPPHLYHCSYEDLSRGVRIPFPFQPEWIMEAMGIAEPGKPEDYEMKVNPTTLELVQRVRSPQGTTVTKKTVVLRAAAQAPNPQVLSHSLLDDKGQEICSAHITKVQVDRLTGAIVPKEVKLVCPSEKVELKMKLDDLTVNDPTVTQNAQRLFGRPNLAGVQSYDLAARSLDPGPNGIRRISGQRFD